MLKADSAVTAVLHDTGTPVLLRNYMPRQDQHRDPTIVQAARATSAAPLFFKPLKAVFQGLEEEYCDAGLGYNNPISLLMDEAAELWQGRQFGCILSIGTGYPKIVGAGPSLVGLLRKTIDIATDAEKIAEDVRKGWDRYSRQLSAVYFRFNVEQGLEDVQLDEYRKFGRVSAMTLHYLSKSRVRKDVDRCAECIKRPTAQSQGTLL
jgi:hypothetical protein